MTDDIPDVKKALKEVTHRELEHATALQRQRMSKERLRKAEDRLKYRNGGMVQKAGLHELPEELILGALLFIAQQLGNPDVKAHALKLGKEALARDAAKKRRERKPREIFIAFDSPPPGDLLATLKALQLRFNRRNKEWRGPANYMLLKGAVMGFGWDKHVVRSGYVK